MLTIMNRRLLLALVAGVTLVLECFQPLATGALAASSPTATATLATFMPSTQPVRLRYTNDEYTVFVPLSGRLKVRGGMLHLQLANSISLIKDRSQVAVRMNGKLLGQIALNPQQPETSIDIRIPGSALKTGYNKLTFTVAQHYTLRCEDPSAPELWTEIDPIASTLSFDSDWQPVTARLSEMANLFDPKLWGSQTFTIVTPGATLRDEQLKWGALVAQGATLHLRYAPLRVFNETAARGAGGANFPGLKQDSLRGTDSALVGTKEELAPFLSKQIQDGIAGSFIGVYALDADPSRFVLVISGTTPAEVAQAASTSAVLGFPYPDTSSMLVTGVEFPKLGNYAGKGTVAQEGTYKFSQFGFKTTTAQGAATSSLINEDHVENIEIEVTMPADLFAHEDTNVDLILHFAYGAALRKDSVLNIMLNNKFERAIALNIDTGVVYNKYQISIPLRSFQPGVNRIRFLPRMMPLITGDCLAIQNENLILTLYDDSTLKMPKASHYVAMPNFRLLGRSGFPYTVNSDGSGALVYVASNDNKTIGAAWTLMAKLAQRHGQALQQTAVTFELAAQEKDIIVVGPAGKIQPAVLKGAPLEMGSPGRIPYPSASAASAADPQPEWLGWLLPGRARSLDVASAEGDGGKAIIVSQTSNLTNGALAMQYRSPFASDRTTTVFMAADEGLLQDAVGELIKPEIWNDLQGNLVVWNKGVTSVAWQKVGADYTLGKVSMPSRLEFYFSRYPWVWIGILIALALLLAALTVRLIQRHRVKTNVSTEGRRQAD